MVAARNHEAPHAVATRRLEHLSGAADVHRGELRPRRVARVAAEVNDGVRSLEGLVEQARIDDRAQVDLDGLARRGRWRRDDVDEARHLGDIGERGAQVGPEPPRSPCDDEGARHPHPGSGSTAAPLRARKSKSHPLSAWPMCSLYNEP